MKRATLLLVLCVILLGISPKILAQSFVVTMHGQEEYDLGGKDVAYLEDKSGQLSLEEVLAPHRADAWQVSKSQILNFGFSSSAYWLRFSIKSDSQKPLAYLLQVAYPVLDNLEFYSLSDVGPLHLQKAGDQLFFSQRPVLNHNFLFKIDVQGQKTFLLRVATKGSVKIPLKLITPERFQHTNERELLQFGFFCGVIVAMMLYNSFLAITMREINYVYYIAYIGLFLLFNLALSGLAYQYLWPRSIWLANFSIPISIYSSSFFALQFSRRFLQTARLTPWFDKAILTLMIWGFLGILLIPFTPYKITTQSSTALALILNLVLVTVGAVLLKRGYRAARFYMIAFAAIWFGMGIKAVQTLGFIGVNVLTENGLTFGSIGEVILLSLALGDKIRHEQRAAQAKIESLNQNLAQTVQNLDTKVEEQTAEIKSMLQNIKQGIFTVRLVDNIPVLNPDFSSFLTEILEVPILAGQPLMNCVFGKAQLTADELSVIQSVLLATLDEPLIAFELNMDRLPREFTLISSHSGPKAIEIDWCPVLAKHSQTVQTILVTLRDMSAFRILEAHSLEQKEELIYISELILVPHSNFIHIVQLSEQLLNENRRLLKSLKGRDIETLKILFINMHTLKGSARQFGLSRLTTQVHCAEQIFADLLRNETLVPQSLPMLETLDEIEAILKRYIKINSTKLNRANTSDQLLIERGHLETWMKTLRGIDPHTLPQATTLALQGLTESIADLAFHNSEQVLREILKNADTLARDLHKAHPFIKIQAKRLHFTANGEDLLRKVLVHMVRNSLDHGIELPEERVQNGKPAAGTIAVIMDQPDSSSLRFRYRDDGRGINIQRLRAIAQDLGLLLEADLNDARKVANSIFTDGISTSKAVTEISGRGMGMGAIKAYIERFGGQIELHLEPSANPHSPFLPFELVLYTPMAKMVA